MSFAIEAELQRIARTVNAFKLLNLEDINYERDKILYL